MPDSADVGAASSGRPGPRTLCDQDAACRRCARCRERPARRRRACGDHAILTKEPAAMSMQPGCSRCPLRNLLARLRRARLVPPVRPKSKRRDERTFPGSRALRRALREQVRRARPTGTRTSAASQSRRRFRHAVELAAQSTASDRSRRTRVEQLEELLDHLRGDHATVGAPAQARNDGRYPDGVVSRDARRYRRSSVPPGPPIGRDRGTRIDRRSTGPG